MGWIFYDSQEIKENGQVDRKSEMDKGFDNHLEVVKSAMVGREYYAALKNIETGKVFAYAASTSSDKKGGSNFGYKGFTESSGPVWAKCPKSILTLLTPTDDQYANEWRERCRKYHKEKGKVKELNNLPYGTKISVGNLTLIKQLYKRNPHSSNKPLTYWIDWSVNKYLRPAQIIERGYVVELLGDGYTGRR